MTRQVWILSLMSIALLSSFSTIAQERAVAALPQQVSTFAIAENRQAFDRASDLPQARVADTDFRVLVGDQSAGN
jgi:hypothetical protein